MNKWVKRTSILLAVVAGGIVGAGVVGNELGARKMARKIAVDVAPVALVSDAAHIAQGRYLFSTRGCAECHGSNGAGKEVFHEGAMLVHSPNLTRGGHSATIAYQPVDWVRTLRHGVKPDGTPVMIMPSEDYNRLTDDDVAAIVSYVQQLPPVDGRAALVQLPVPVRALYGYGAIRDAAEKIDHKLAPSQPVDAAVTPAYGAYVANSCIGCHGASFSGGKIPGAPPTWPASANLTPGKGGVMTRYGTPELFMAMLRSGHRPDGSAISKVMPFASLGALNDTDVRALHAFLLALAPRPAGQR